MAYVVKLRQPVKTAQSDLSLCGPPGHVPVRHQRYDGIRTRIFSRSWSVGFTHRGPLAKSLSPSNSWAGLSDASVGSRIAHRRLPAVRFDRLGRPRFSDDGLWPDLPADCRAQPAERTEPQRLGSYVRPPYRRCS